MRFMLFTGIGRMIDDNIPCTSAVHRESIDGEWYDTLQMDVAGTIEKGRYIVYRDNQGEWHEYRVTAPDELREAGAPDCNVQAVNSVQELAFSRPITYFHETNVTLRRAVEYAVLDTRWQAGQIETDDVKTLDELTLENTDGWALLQQIASTWGLELYTTVTMEKATDQIGARTVNLVRQRGTVTGKRFEYGADLQRVRRTYTEREVYTRVIPIGKTTTDSETGVRTTVTISEVNKGRDYLEADDAQDMLTRWGVPDRTGNMVHPTIVVSYPDAENASDLYNLAKADLSTYTTPKVQYEATVDSYRNAGLKDPGSLRVGDTVQIVDTTFNPALRLEGRMSGVEEDLMGDDTQKTITLGSIIESMAERQTINTKTAETVERGKPVWDAASATASSAHDTATNVSGEVSGLTTRVTKAQSTADKAQSAADKAQSAAQSAAAALVPIGGMSDVVVKQGQFADGLSATVKVTDLPSSMVAGPPPVREQIDLWLECRPVVEDHDADESIPAGSIRVTVGSMPAQDLTVRLAALKGGGS